MKEVLTKDYPRPKQFRHQLQISVEVHSSVDKRKKIEKLRVSGKW